MLPPKPPKTQAQTAIWTKITALLRAPLPPKCKLILLAIEAETERNGQCRLLYRELGGTVGFSDIWARNAAEQAAKQGILKMTRHGGSHLGNQFEIIWANVPVRNECCAEGKR